MLLAKFDSEIRSVVKYQATEFVKKIIKMDFPNVMLKIIQIY